MKVKDLAKMVNTNGECVSINMNIIIETIQTDMAILVANRAKEDHLISMSVRLSILREIKQKVIATVAALDTDIIIFSISTEI